MINNKIFIEITEWRIHIRFIKLYILVKEFEYTLRQWVLGWNDKFLIKKQKANIVTAKTIIEIVIEYQKSIWHHYYSHVSHLMIFAVRIYEKALVVLSVHIFLPLYGFCVCIVVCVRVNLSLSSMALACNVSRARGVEAWHLSVTHLLCPSLMMPAWWQITLHACHPLTDRRRERDRKRESEIERERRRRRRKAQLICFYFPTLSQSQPF